MLTYLIRFPISIHSISFRSYPLNTKIKRSATMRPTRLTRVRHLLSHTLVQYGTSSTTHRSYYTTVLYCTVQQLRKQLNLLRHFTKTIRRTRSEHESAHYPQPPTYSQYFNSNSNCMIFNSNSNCIISEAASMLGSPTFYSNGSQILVQYQRTVDTNKIT